MKEEEYRWIENVDLVHDDEILSLSFELAQAGQLEEAVREVKRQISKHPSQPLSNFWLGILLYDLEEYAEACNAFKTELVLSPYFREAAWELASASSKLGQVEKTIEAYHKALDIDPCCVQALFGLGNAYGRLGNLDEAIEYYKDAAFLLPELDYSDPRTTDEAAKAFAAKIHYNLAVMLMQTGNSEGAYESFKTVQEILPGERLATLSEYYQKVISDMGDDLRFSAWSMVELPSM